MTFKSTRRVYYYTVNNTSWRRITYYNYQGCDFIAFTPGFIRNIRVKLKICFTTRRTKIQSRVPYDYLDFSDISGLYEVILHFYRFLIGIDYIFFFSIRKLVYNKCSIRDSLVLNLWNVYMNRLFDCLTYITRSWPSLLSHLPIWCYEVLRCISAFYLSYTIALIYN